MKIKQKWVQCLKINLVATENANIYQKIPICLKEKYPATNADKIRLIKKLLFTQFFVKKAIRNS